MHTLGSKSHNLYPHHSPEHEEITTALKRLALPEEAWQLVRTNLSSAAGGPAAEVAVSEKERTIHALTELGVHEFAVGEKAVPSTAVSEMAVMVGKQDPSFLVTNADGNGASGLGRINIELKIVHPTEDQTYFQGPAGQVYEPLSEDACAGTAAALALAGGRALWLSYESFAVNGMPVWQTVTQAMAELRRDTPAAVALFTAGALEQGRNGWTHQRPEIEAYFAALMRNGNVYPLFPTDANVIQACYEWALGEKNIGAAMFASKSPLPVYTTMTQARDAVEKGYFIMKGDTGAEVTFAVAGDMVLLPVLQAAEELEAAGTSVRVVSVVNPRRMFLPEDVLFAESRRNDNGFLGEDEFNSVFGTGALVAVTGGASAILEPVFTRHKGKSAVKSWKRGDTVASPDALFAFNGVDAESLIKTAKGLL